MKPLGVLILAWFFLSGAIGVGLIGPNRSAIRAAYGLSETEYGAGLAAIQIASAGCILLAAPRLRRFNPVRIMTAGLAVQVAGFAAISFSAGLAWLAAGWALVTAGMALGSVGNNISMDLSPGDPRRGVVMLHAFNAAGKVGGPLLAAACLAIAWRLSFAAVGAVTLTVLAVFWVLRRRSEAVYADRAERAGTGLAWGVLRRPAYWFFAISIGLVAGGEGAFVSLVPEYFERVRHTSAVGGTLLLVVHLAGLTAGRFASALLARRLSNSAVIGACLAAGLFVFPAVLLENLAAASAALFVMGLMFSSTWPSFYAQASQHLADGRDMMPYGSALGNTLGISLCLFAGGALADADLGLAMFFGPAVLWAFGAAYFASPLSRRPRTARAA